MSVWCANGHENDDTAMFCSSCGVGIAPGAMPPPPPPGGAGQLPGYPAPPPGYNSGPGAPPPPQPGYPAHGPYGFAPQAPFNGLAIASMVLGIVWCYWIGSILALIFGIIARRQILRGNQRGMGMAIAGIVLGCVGIATLVGGIILIIVAHVSSSNSTGTANLDLLFR